jgi:hypothetical protein
MGLKPMDKRNGYDTRQTVWEAIRAKRVFNIKDIRWETTLRPESVRDYVVGLENGGYLERVDPSEMGPGVAACWRLVRDIGFEAPRVRKDGTPVTQGQGRENMWNAMRIMRFFTARELAVAARTPDCFVKESTAADYAKHLWHAGYLAKSDDGVYRMLPTAYTGPKAPMIQRTKVVWDPNQNKVRWRSGEGEVDDDQ